LQQSMKEKADRALIMGSGCAELDDVIVVLPYLGVEVDVLADSTEALQRVKHAPYELVVCYDTTFSTTLLEFCRAVRRVNRLVPLVVICKESQVEDRVLVLEIGADEFLNSGGSRLELRARVGTVLRRFRAYREVSFADRKRCVSIGNLEVDLNKKQARINGKPLDLTPSEYTLLEILILNAGKTIIRSQLGATLWGCDSDVYEENVMCHVSRLRKKLGGSAEKEGYIVTVRSRGYRLISSDELTSRNCKLNSNPVDTI